MQDFYHDFSEKPKRPSSFWKGLLIGSIIMCLLLVTFYYYFQVKPGDINEQQLTLPWEEKNGSQDNDQEDDNPLDISPGAREYYLAVVKAAERVTPSVVGISNYGLVFDLWEEQAAGKGYWLRGNHQQ